MRLSKVLDARLQIPDARKQTQDNRSVLWKFVNLFKERRLLDFKKLKVWEKAHLLTISVYKVTADFPKAEVYGLTSQLRRACSSIAANIAEGCGRGGNAEISRFFTIAMGSSNEVEYHLLLARDLGYLSSSDHDSMNADLTHVRRMLVAYVKKIKESNVISNKI